MNEDRLIRLPEVMRLIPLSRASLYAMMARGEFPRPCKIGGGRASFWRQSEVERFRKPPPPQLQRHAKGVGDMSRWDYRDSHGCINCRRLETGLHRAERMWREERRQREAIEKTFLVRAVRFLFPKWGR